MAIAADCGHTAMGSICDRMLGAGLFDQDKGEKRDAKRPDPSSPSFRRQSAHDHLSIAAADNSAARSWIYTPSD